jgi:hypothetical protein
MKSLHVFLFALALTPLGAFADIIYPDGHAPSAEPYEIRKIGRGLNNLVMAPFEIPKAIFDIGQQEGVMSPQQFSVGLLRGPVNMFLRLGEAGNALCYWHDNSDKPLLHLEPMYLSPFDVVPGWQSMFSWDTIDTPAFRMDTPKTPTTR